MNFNYFQHLNDIPKCDQNKPQENNHKNVQINKTNFEDIEYVSKYFFFFLNVVFMKLIN